MADKDRIPNPQQDFVLKTIKNRDVHFIRCWFADVLGNMKSFAVVPGEIEKAFIEGMGFDGSSINGFMASHHADILAYPDAETFHVLPWRPESNAVARMFCNLKTPNGQPFEGDPRHILKMVLKKVADAGFTCNVGTQLEFFYFSSPEDTEILDHGNNFDLTSLDYASDLRRDTVLTLEKMGIPVEFSYHEKAPSQHEIDLRYNDALAMADSVMTYKLVVKEIAMKHGVYASFMPKPITEYPGSGMHIHLSLFNEDGNNAFFDSDDPSGYNLSSTAKHFIAGLLKYAPEYCLVTNQYVNSYKRLASGMSAPACISWARGNRSTMVRIPSYRPDVADSCRVEVRSPDPAANPYLAIAVMVAAGLAGIEEKLEAPDPMESYDFFDIPKETIEEMGLSVLPQTLGDAVEAFAKSRLMKDVLGDLVHDYLVDQKRSDWREFQQVVTPWELENSLAVL